MFVTEYVWRQYNTHRMCPYILKCQHSILAWDATRKETHLCITVQSSYCACLLYHLDNPNELPMLTYAGINLVKDEYRASYRDLVIYEESKLYFILQAGYRYSSVWLECSIRYRLSMNACFLNMIFIIFIRIFIYFHIIIWICLHHEYQESVIILDRKCIYFKNLRFNFLLSITPMLRFHVQEHSSCPFTWKAR